MRREGQLRRAQTQVDSSAHVMPTVQKSKLLVGETYNMPVVGKWNPQSCGLLGFTEFYYGVVNGQKIMLLDRFGAGFHIGIEVETPPASYNLGDSIDVKILKIGEREAFGLPVTNHGPYLADKVGTEIEAKVLIHGQSKSDVRDAVTLPLYNGGIFGTLGIIKRFKSMENYDAIRNRRHEYLRLKVVHFGHTKRGENFVVCELSDKAKEWNLEKEVFVGAWTKGKDVWEPNWHREPVYPSITELPTALEGIPERSSPEIAFYMDSPNDMFLFYKSGAFGLKGMTPAQGIAEFVKVCKQGDLKVALARERYPNYQISLLENAIEQAGFNHTTLRTKFY